MLSPFPVEPRPASRRVVRRIWQVPRSMDRRLVVRRPLSHRRVVVPRSLNRRHVLVPRSMNRRQVVLRPGGRCFAVPRHLLHRPDMLLRVFRCECWARSRRGSGPRIVVVQGRPLRLPLLRPPPQSLLTLLLVMVVWRLVSLLY